MSKGTNQMGFEDYKYEGKQIPMEEIRVLHFAVGNQIPAVRNATFKIFTPGLVENKEKIECITPVTETYGSHARHKLDIYEAKEDEGPILVFFYGGGFVRGDRIVQDLGHGLVYHNLGTFFASRGITTVIPDYRRVNSPGGGEDAVFPSGGEDVSLVLKWLETSKILGNRRREVILLGNSAGAAHVSTFLFEKQFLEQRRGYVGNKGLINGAKEAVLGSTGIALTGAVLLSNPAHFHNAAKERKEALKNYYGSEDNAVNNCTLGLLKQLTQSSTPLQEAYIPKILSLVGEYDPQDEIAGPMEDFANLWKESFSSGLESRVLQGHNHISPPIALMSGDEKGEKWGEDLVQWILGHPSHILKAAIEIPRGPKKTDSKKVDEDTSTNDAAREDEKSGKAIPSREKKADPSEDYSTDAINDKDKSQKKVDPTEDTSTREAVEVDEKYGNAETANPTEDFSTEAERKKEGSDAKTVPSQDFSTEAAKKLFGQDNKPFGSENPREDASTQDAAEMDRKGMTA